MSINIKGAAGKPSQSSRKKVGTSGSSKKNAASAAAQNTDNDSVDLTKAATQIQQIEQSLASIPIVDSSKVQAVSESIEQGQYQINEERIADRIIDIEKNIDNK